MLSRNAERVISTLRNEELADDSYINALRADPSKAEPFLKIVNRIIAAQYMRMGADDEFVPSSLLSKVMGNYDLAVGFHLCYQKVSLKFDQFEDLVDKLIASKEIILKLEEIKLLNDATMMLLFRGRKILPMLLDAQLMNQARLDEILKIPQFETLHQIVFELNNSKLLNEKNLKAIIKLFESASSDQMNCLSISLFKLATNSSLDQISLDYVIAHVNDARNVMFQIDKLDQAGIKKLIENNKQEKQQPIVVMESKTENATASQAGMFACVSKRAMPRTNPFKAIYNPNYHSQTNSESKQQDKKANQIKYCTPWGK